jgi:hypothetical protein
LEARHGLRSSPQAAPKLRIFHFQPPGATERRGLLHNFDVYVWLFILLGGMGGMIIALVIKHADNILRGFASGLALILTSLGSHLLYGFAFTPEFVCGTCMVVASIFLYNGKAQDLHSGCLGRATDVANRMHGYRECQSPSTEGGDTAISRSYQNSR